MGERKNTKYKSLPDREKAWLSDAKDLRTEITNAVCWAVLNEAIILQIMWKAIFGRASCTAVKVGGNTAILQYCNTAVKVGSNQNSQSPALLRSR